MKYQIAPSLLSADFTRLSMAVRIAEEGGAGRLHLDVMDGHFVPNLTFGPMLVEAVSRMTDLPLDVHLMIEKPERYIDQFAKAGASYISVHYEAVTHLNRVIHQIKDLGVRAGVALNPHTPVEVLTDVLYTLDFVLIMSVNPGFGGQKFIHQTYSKLKRMQQLFDATGYTPEVEIDGGVGLSNIQQLSGYGVRVFVAGSAVYGSEDPVRSMRDMYSLLH